MLFIPAHSQRQGEGGLRTKGVTTHLNFEQPLVSIITVVFNGERYIEETILSVLNQSYNNIEYIIIDGLSTDKTVKKICQYEDRIDYWISEPDAGIYDAMNKGILAAKGKLIGLINCGDTYTPNAVREVVKIFQNAESNTDYLVITGAMYRFDSQRNLKFRIAKDRWQLDSKINYGMPLNHPATFVTKATYEKFGLFNTAYQICGDYEFIFRIYYSSLVKFEFTELELANMRLGGISEKFSSLWLRCREHFFITQAQLPIIKNLSIRCKWYAMTATKFVLRKAASNSLMSIYYELRHGK